jgi:hypothetical protein
MVPYLLSLLLGSLFWSAVFWAGPAAIVQNSGLDTRYGLSIPTCEYWGVCLMRHAASPYGGNGV